MQLTVLEITLIVTLFLSVIFIVYLSAELIWTRKSKGITDEDEATRKQMQYDEAKKACKAALVEYSNEIEKSQKTMPKDGKK